MSSEIMARVWQNSQAGGDKRDHPAPLGGGE